MIDASIRTGLQQDGYTVNRARDAVDDRITGLDAGADDYLVKSFDLNELIRNLRGVGYMVPRQT